jgi:hypothetical protein
MVSSDEDIEETTTTILMTVEEGEDGFEDEGDELR